jgi:homoserine kinase
MPLAVTVKVPASSANLGPGFDCLGLALAIYLRASCREAGSELRITANEPEIATDASNLIYKALSLVCEAAGKAVAAGLELGIDNAIPLSRGLGSSAAAIAAGLMLGNALCGSPFDKQRLLEIGLPLEGHPDNLAPALFGGLRVSSLAGDRVLSLPVSLPKPPGIALFVPDFPMSTAEARRVLPAEVPRADAIFNTCRSSLLVAALAAGDLSVLRWAMEDRLHQHYRSTIFRALPKLIDAALDAGAAGAALSGAGSTVIAFVDGDPAPVAQAMAAAGVSGKPLTAEIDPDGARV